jgi:hypothetical protein
MEFVQLELALEESAKGNVKYLGDFEQYLDEKDD